MKTANKLLRIIGAAMLIVCLMGNTQCQNPANSVVITPGPIATEMGKKQDEEIAKLKNQVQQTQDANKLIEAQSAKAASSFKGVLKVTDYLPSGLPKDAITEESNLGLTRLPPDDPAETVKALERVIQIVTGQRDAAKKAYDEAFADAKSSKALLAQKEKSIQDLNGQIAGLEKTVQQLHVLADKEQVDHANDVKNKIAEVKSFYENKERDWLMKAIGVGSVMLIFGGILLIAITRGAELITGGIMIVGGALVILLRMGYLSLMAQPWFPYVAGVGAILIVGAMVWGVYNLWQRVTLDQKKAQAIQDFKDESATKGNGQWNLLAPHLQYRMGPSTSYWGKVQKSLLEKFGLINAAGEATLSAKTPNSANVPPSTPAN